MKTWFLETPAGGETVEADSTRISSNGVLVFFVIVEFKDIDTKKTKRKLEVVRAYAAGSWNSVKETPV